MPAGKKWWFCERGAIEVFPLALIALIGLTTIIVIGAVQQNQDFRSRSQVYPCGGENQACCAVNTCNAGLNCTPLPGGYFCIKPACTNGTKQCSGDGQYVQACQSGQFVNTQRCDAGCNRSATPAACNPTICSCPHACSAGQGGCWWGSGPNQCDTRCCSEGACPGYAGCTNPNGANGDARCTSSTQVSVCQNGSWNTVACASGWTCDSTQNRCVAPPTPPTSCQNVNQSCSGSGQGTCCASYFCVPLPGGNVCRPPECSSGYRQCSGSNLQECQNRQWVTIQSCPAGQECNSSTFTCQLPSCANQGGNCYYGVSDCVAGLRRSPISGTSCPTGAICCGASLPNLCTSGESYCVSSTTAAVCKADRSGYTYITCVSGTSCDSSLKRCVPKVIPSPTIQPTPSQLGRNLPIGSTCQYPGECSSGFCKYDRGIDVSVCAQPPNCASTDTCRAGSCLTGSAPLVDYACNKAGDICCTSDLPASCQDTGRMCSGNNYSLGCYSDHEPITFCPYGCNGQLGECLPGILKKDGEACQSSVECQSNNCQEVSGKRLCAPPLPLCLSTYTDCRNVGSSVDCQSNETVCETTKAGGIPTNACCIGPQPQQKICSTNGQFVLVVNSDGGIDWSNSQRCKRGCQNSACIGNEVIMTGDCQNGEISLDGTEKCENGSFLCIPGKIQQPLKYGDRLYICDTNHSWIYSEILTSAYYKSLTCKGNTLYRSVLGIETKVKTCESGFVCLAYRDFNRAGCYTNEQAEQLLGCTLNSISVISGDRMKCTPQGYQCIPGSDYGSYKQCVEVDGKYELRVTTPVSSTGMTEIVFNSLVNKSCDPSQIDEIFEGRFTLTTGETKKCKLYCSKEGVVKKDYCSTLTTVKPGVPYCVVDKVTVNMNQGDPKIIQTCGIGTRCIVSIVGTTCADIPLCHEGSCMQSRDAPCTTPGDIKPNTDTPGTYLQCDPRTNQWQ